MNKYNSILNKYSKAKSSSFFDKDNIFNVEVEEYDTKKKLCENCETELEHIYDDDEWICNTCGMVREAAPINEGLKVSSSNQYENEQPFFGTQKTNHFIEWLNQIQSKGVVPTEVLVDVRNQLAKMHVTDMTLVDYEIIRLILKRLEYNNCYIHIYPIINKLKNTEGVSIDEKTESVLKEMFRELQVPFVEVKPDDRHNFLSYSYVLFKLCQLLDRKDLMKQFPLLKSRDKLIIQDKIWKKMMEKLNWEYIPSV